MQKAWWKEGVVYQIYPRSFQDSNGDGIGDLRGIINRLDYLKKLGVDIVWLSPVYQSPNDDNGYDISDYYAIMQEFGTMEDMEELITEMHQRGMKLVMDLVVNHTSDEHPWFIEARSSKNNPYRDYYIWHPGKNGLPPNNWRSSFGGSAWEYDEKTGEYYLHLFSKKQVDLNWENPEVRQKVYQMMKWWLDKGIDGFRMDVINFISKVPGLPDGEPIPGTKYGDGRPYYINGPKVHDYLQEMNREVLSHYDIMTVGETPGVTPEEACKYVNFDRHELNMLFQFELMELDRQPSNKWIYRQWKLTEMKEILTKWYEGLKEKGWNSLFMSNHDQARMVSRFGDDGQYRQESAKMLATLLHTLPGTPYIYQGEEIGMTNVAFTDIKDYRDIETLNMYQEEKELGRFSEAEIMEAIHRTSRDNARTPMQWDDGPGAGFTTGTPWIKLNPNYKEINVKKALEDPDSIFYYYQKLIKLRKANPIIVYGDYQLLLAEHQEIYAYLRHYEDDRLLIILNFFGGEPEFQLPFHLKYTSKELLISNYPVDPSAEIREFKMRPYEARVYRLK